MSTFTIVLPTYNEAENIGMMIRRIRECAGNDPEILVADDNSPDGTAEAAEKAAKEYPNVRVLRNPGKRGLSPSVVFGFHQTDADWLCCMDADGQHRPEDLKTMIAAAEKTSAVMIFGSRHVPGGGFTEKWNFFRSLSSRTATLAAQWMLGIKIHDPMSGFFMIRRDVFQKIEKDLSPDGFKIALELLNLAVLLPGAEILEHPITFAMRGHGESKFSSKVILQYLAMLRRCRKLRNRILSGKKESR